MTTEATPTTAMIVIIMELIPAFVAVGAAAVVLCTQSWDNTVGVGGVGDVVVYSVT